MNEDRGKREDVFSKAVRAGKRTYFFDVKSTRGNDLYLTITESKKKYQDDGKFFFEKHKLFLYKEDFEKFAIGLQEAIDRISELKNSDGKFAEVEESETGQTTEKADKPVGDETSEFTDINFDDLGK